MNDTRLAIYCVASGHGYAKKGFARQKTRIFEMLHEKIVDFCSTSTTYCCGVQSRLEQCDADYLTNERLATTLPLREETLFLASRVSRRVA